MKCSFRLQMRCRIQASARTFWEKPTCHAKNPLAGHCFFKRYVTSISLSMLILFCVINYKLFIIFNTKSPTRFRRKIEAQFLIVLVYFIKSKEQKNLKPGWVNSFLCSLLFRIYAGNFFRQKWWYLRTLLSNKINVKWLFSCLVDFAYRVWPIGVILRSKRL